MEDNLLFRDIILIKSDLFNIYQQNKFKGYIYNKYYLNKIKRLINNLKDNPIDIPLLKGFYEFLKLTRINLDEEYKRIYNVVLFSNTNSICIIVNSEINFIISIFMDNRIAITYCDENKRYMYEMNDNLSNFDNKDREKSIILTLINEKISDIIIFSIINYFKRKRV